MNIAKKSVALHVFCAGIAGLIAALCLYPAHVQAQTPAVGNNSVYNTSGTVKGSYAYVDASVFDTGAGDVCADISSAFGAVYSGAPMAVIDARGIKPGSNICGSSPFPSGAIPSVVLLPAGKIPIQALWVLPNRTRIIGEGADPTSTGMTGTIIQATSGLPSSTYMIQFGSSSPVCPSNICYGIGVENLTLDGANQSVGGIQNISSQERSYVNQVGLRNFNGTGLYVGTSGGAGQNSGPYSNIRFRAENESTTAVCAVISGIGSTRGIHNLNCTGGGGPVGIYLDASGNSLEDISVSGFTDGILIGDSENARGNVVLNVTGDSTLSNVVDISANSVSDLSLLQINRNGATNAIKDNTILISSGSAPTLVTDNQVAIYAIGEPMGNGFSRFTTASHSTQVPAWLVGSGAASGSCASPNLTGTLYSDTFNGLQPDTLYICNGSSWVVVR